MSDFIKHECGIALIRLRKPLNFYIEKYGTPAYAMNKLYLLMEKQHNRGQDGAGVANIKIDIKPGYRYISRYRSIQPQPIADIFKKISKKYRKAQKENPQKFYNGQWLKENVAFTGELWLGHLRYGTHGENSIEQVHPFLRQNNWRSRNLVIAGNFNMTNVDDLFDKLVSIGQHPKEKVDTVTVMEKIGHFLDLENQVIFDKYKDKFSNQEITDLIATEIDLARVLERSCKDFDGGYAMAGLTGYGGAFVARDPNGIRPAYYYADDEVVVVASEKPPIKMAFDVEFNEIREIKPGHALTITKDGQYNEHRFIEPKQKLSCSFERIYFSRGTDPDIYTERKMLGRLLLPQILKSINFDLKNTVFSYIPNTAESAFLGLLDSLDVYLIGKRKDVFLENKPFLDSREELLSFRPRVEKIVLKDAKLRTFITDIDHRDDLVSHVYDTTYEVIRKGIDSIVILDDSIVRGTTLERSILTLIDKIGPKKIVVVSSAPQIRYPDCYGIDMSRMNEFIAFRALMALLKENDMEFKLDEVYDKARVTENRDNQPNYVKELYDLFTQDEISRKIGEIVTPKNMKSEVEIVYQTVENLHRACPNHLGDWYFTGHYPTQGGNRVVNKSFMNFMEGLTVRAY
ncbi:MAG: amidophosphoribosyltransferase [Cyclobacteriaceae bacterium]|nr:amidophosphoribosyltransferase [Cyclobacteriaceae bacterium]